MRFVDLPRDEFAGGELRYIFDSTSCYRAEITQKERDFTVSLTCHAAPRRHFDYITRIYDPRLTDARVFTLVDNDGERVGFAEVASENDGRRRLLTNLLVEDGYRRRGYGTLLLSRARTQARGAGAEELRVFVSAVNAGAVRFFLTQGFALSGFSSLGEELALELSVRP